MKIEATTIDEFFDNSGAHVETLKYLDDFIQKCLPDIDRKLYTSDTACVLGYGEIPYKNTNYSGTIPIISITPQKNNVSLYIMAWKDGNNLVETYAHKLGKISNGKSCVRIKKFSDLQLAELQKLLMDAYDVYKSIVKNVKLI